MTIYLVRHGETALNVGRVLQPADTPLGERGLLQARAVARRLANVAVGAIVSSDLPRALQTAGAIAAATGVPIETTPLLQERNFGDLRGQAYDALPYNPIASELAPPGGESMPVFRERVARAFAHVVARHATLTGPLVDLVVVSHGLVIQEILSGHVTHGPGTSAPISIANTSVTIFGGQPPHLVELMDCTRHLDDGAAYDAKSLSGG